MDIRRICVCLGGCDAALTRWVAWICWTTPGCTTNYPNSSPEWHREVVYRLCMTTVCCRTPLPSRCSWGRCWWPWPSATSRASREARPLSIWRRQWRPALRSCQPRSCAKCVWPYRWSSSTAQSTNSTPRRRQAARPLCHPHRQESVWVRVVVVVAAAVGGWHKQCRPRQQRWRMGAPHGPFTCSTSFQGPFPLLCSLHCRTCLMWSTS
mmetsp:Transcript_1211/g.3127  ORF Transcript_1211/g.3127 Transcript_1211/m.3127 type:complete len:209 (+) Transcript_1211:572-1198(+)